MPEDDRDTLLAYDELVCPRCGNLRAECENPDLDWHPRTSVCWAMATEEWAGRRLQARHEGEKVSDDALHPLDGRWVWVSTVAPAEGEDEFA